MPWNQSPERSASPAARRNAGTLRRRMTDAEKRLWWHLRHAIPLQGTHFRRQVALGPYVVDFCSHKARLVVEVDGGGHSRDERIAADGVRDAALATQGYTVLRFTNSDVTRTIDQVLETVVAQVQPYLEA